MEDYDWQESFALTCGTKEQQDYYKNLFKDKFNKKNMRIEGEERYFSAEDARRVSNEISTGQMHEQLDWIYKLINEARFDGKREVLIKHCLNLQKIFLSQKDSRFHISMGTSEIPLMIQQYLGKHNGIHGGENRRKSTKYGWAIL